MDTMINVRRSQSFRTDTGVGGSINQDGIGTTSGTPPKP